MAVRVEHDGGVTVVTIDRSEARNAVDGPTAAALADAFRAFDGDDDRAVAVLTGAGATFCAGADLKAFRTELLRSLSLTCTGFEFCPEVTAKLGNRRVQIVEVPISYSARDVAAGKKVRWTDGFEAMWVLCKHRIKRD